MHGKVADFVSTQGSQNILKDEHICSVTGARGIVFGDKEYFFSCAHVPVMQGDYFISGVFLFGKPGFLL